MEKTKKVPTSVHRLIDSLQAGDLISLAGNLRIVRHVSRDAHDRVRCITLAIQRASWTNRANTTVARADLYWRNLELVRAGFSDLDGWLDKRFTYSIEHPHAEDRLVAKDVIGILL